MSNRNWLITNNNPDNWKEDLARLWNSGKFKYVGGQLEKGENGTLHLQAAVQAYEKISIKLLKTWIPKGHFEQIKVDNGAFDYVTKEETRQDGPLEYGTKPLKHKDRAKKGGNEVAMKYELRNALLIEKGAVKAVTDGVIKADDYRKVRDSLTAFNLDSKELKNAEGIRGVWIYGDPGVGKSHFARETYKDAFIKAQNKWWDGYMGEKNVILEDLDKSGACLGHYLKIWADKWSCTGEIKGSTVPLIHENFVITSNYLPAQLWPEDKILVEAISRRFKFFMGSINSNGEREFNIFYP